MLFDGLIGLMSMGEWVFGVRERGQVTEAKRGQVFSIRQDSKSFQSVSTVSTLSKSTCVAAIVPRCTAIEARNTRGSLVSMACLAACSIMLYMTTLNLRMSSPMASNWVLTAV